MIFYLDICAAVRPFGVSENSSAEDLRVTFVIPVFILIEHDLTVRKNTHACTVGDVSLFFQRANFAHYLNITHRFVFEAPKRVDSLVKLLVSLSTKKRYTRN